MKRQSSQTSLFCESSSSCDDDSFPSTERKVVTQSRLDELKGNSSLYSPLARKLSGLFKTDNKGKSVLERTNKCDKKKRPRQPLIETTEARTSEVGQRNETLIEKKVGYVV